RRSIDTRPARQAGASPCASTTGVYMDSGARARRRGVRERAQGTSCGMGDDRTIIRSSRFDTHLTQERAMDPELEPRHTNAETLCHSDQAPTPSDRREAPAVEEPR